MNVVVFGDSITWGAFDTEAGGWVERLKTHLYNKNPDVYIYNCGVSGDFVSHLLSRVEVEAKARRPEKVILAIGINDSPHSENPQGTRIPDFQEQYKELLEKVQSFTKNIIIVGLTNVDEEVDEYYKNQEIKKYDEVVKRIAEESNLPFVEFFGVLEKDDLADGLHPNAKGHKKILKKVLEKLEG
ncbi:MAG: GDSL-type esterase/lipase family protein [bacterium]|nr:GDSL-type esterase/lipase family protein [bacterium]